MRIDILSKEYPPAIYGGAGVHVAELVRALRERGDLDVRVHAFGEPREEDGTTGHPDLVELAGANAGADAPWASTWRWPPRARAPTSCTRTPGTPTWAATSPR